MLQDEWFNLTEVRAAEQLSDGTTAGFIESLITVIDSGLVQRLDDELQKHGLNLGQVMELRSQVLAEQTGCRERGERRTLDTTSRSAVRQLFLAAFDAEQIAGMLDLAEDEVQGFLNMNQSHPKAQEVVALHHKGMFAVDIAKEVDLHRYVVRRILEQAGLTPNNKRELLTKRQKQHILRLVKEGGRSQREIAAEVGVPVHAVKNTVRLAKEAS